MSTGTIQFRCNPPLSSRLEDLSAQWQVSTSEVARRLAALAAHGFGIADHDRVAAFAARWGNGHAFATAAEFFSSEQDRADA